MLNFRNFHRRTTDVADANFSPPPPSPESQPGPRSQIQPLYPVNDFRSCTGYLFRINDGPISWTSHKQSTIAHSTTKAEYMALSDAFREAIMRTHLYKEPGINTNAPVIQSDNQGALAIAENPTNYQRTKHIDLRYHFIRYMLEESKIMIDYVPTDQQPADILTKALGPQKHLCCLVLMGLRVLETIWRSEPFRR